MCTIFWSVLSEKLGFQTVPLLGGSYSFVTVALKEDKEQQVHTFAHST